MIKKRRKGGGRKFADGKITKANFIKRAREWFSINRSVGGFLNKIKISRQTYYRALNKHPKLKKEIAESRKNIVKNRQKMFDWLRRHPDKDITDYHLRDISLFNPIVIEQKEITIEK